MAVCSTGFLLPEPSSAPGCRYSFPLIVATIVSLNILLLVRARNRDSSLAERRTSARTVAGSNSGRSGEENFLLQS